jgi:hypothetical protein
MPSKTPFPVAQAKDDDSLGSLPSYQSDGSSQASFQEDSSVDSNPTETQTENPPQAGPTREQDPSLPNQGQQSLSDPNPPSSDSSEDSDGNSSLSDAPGHRPSRPSNNLSEEKEDPGEDPDHSSSEDDDSSAESIIENMQTLFGADHPIVKPTQESTSAEEPVSVDDDGHEVMLPRDATVPASIDQATITADSREGEEHFGMLSTMPTSSRTKVECTTMIIPVSATLVTTPG